MGVGSQDAKLSFLRRVFGQVQSSRDGKNVAVTCPKCRESHKKKLAIRLEGDLCHCWVCGLSGRLVSILVQFKPSAVHEYVTKHAAAGCHADPAGVPSATCPVAVPSGFRLLATLIGQRSDADVRRAIRYLFARGLTERDLWFFRFGVSDDPSMYRRVVMPSFDAEGALNFYTGRALDSDPYRKYMNCDAEKKTVVFNELNIDWGKELTLVEGPFDLTKCDENATCLLGSSLSEDSLLFHRIYQHMTPIVLALDDDMVDKAWQRTARMLSSYGVPVRVLDLGGAKDVGEMTKAQFLVAKQQARPWDRMDALRMKVERLIV